MPRPGDDVIAVGVSVETVSVPEEEADEEVGRGWLGRYGDVTVEAIVDIS